MARRFARQEYIRLALEEETADGADGDGDGDGDAWAPAGAADALLEATGACCMLQCLGNVFLSSACCATVLRCDGIGVNYSRRQHANICSAAL